MWPVVWIAACIVVATAAVRSSGQAEPARGKPSESIVQLVIDYGDGVQKHFTRLPWRDGITVLDVMLAAAQHPRGIRVQHRGKGATVLVTQIDDVHNEGGTGTGRNWIYRVNDQVGERSAGIRAVEPGDKILWSFEGM
jgi:hypothetical protein